MSVISRTDVETIVVDNGSVDDTCSSISSRFPMVILVKNDTNKGVAYARNRGMERSTGDYILILDNDTIANSDAIDGMLRYMDENMSVGICGCRLVNCQGDVQQSYKKFPSIITKIRNVLSSDKSGVAIDPPTEVIYPDYVIGACQMIRRKVLEMIGLLDEHIFYGPEDADYCLRARQQGWHVVYLPQFAIIHLWQRASSRKLFSRLSWRHMCGLMYFYVKYRRIH